MRSRKPIIRHITVMVILTVFMVSVLTAGYAVKETSFTLTNELDRIKTRHDDGFSTPEEIGKDDPHFGWGLGTFYIQGYTEVLKEEDGTPVFLKNVGDELILGFDLNRRIDKLGKGGKCQISEDTNGFDKTFQVEQTDFGHGCLLVLETDYQNKSRKPVIYTDYLTAVQKKTANTRVKPFAEGDYTVALDYELQYPGALGIAAYNDYKIQFSFKIRNSNCMVFFYKLGETKDEITNGAVAEDGFKIDFKNSYFLTVKVTKEILVDNDGILTLDTRFNKAVSDGDEFADEGLYTITVANHYTKEQVTKKISVGHNKVLNVYAAHNGTVDPNDIAKKLEQGVEINDQWQMLLPEANAEDSYNSQENNYNGFRSVDYSGTGSASGWITSLNVSIFALVVIVLIIVLKLIEKVKKKKSDKFNAGIIRDIPKEGDAPTLQLEDNPEAEAFGQDAFSSDSTPEDDDFRKEGKR